MYVYLNGCMLDLFHNRNTQENGQFTHPPSPKKPTPLDSFAGLNHLE